MSATAQTTPELLELGLVSMIPTVKVGTGRQPLPAKALGNLIRVVVDSHLHLPDMFELTFLDLERTVLDDAGFKLGLEIEVRGGALNEKRDWSLAVGEITAMEGQYGGSIRTTVVRGYSHEHRLQRGRRSRTFLDAKDSDVAKQLAGDAGLQLGQIDATTQVHPQLAQADQTDWAFLMERATEIGYETGVAEGKFYFRKAHTVQQGTALAVTAGRELLSFRPRISVANLVPEVETRVQDPAEAKAVSAKAAVTTISADVGAGTASTAADQFKPMKPPKPPPTTENGPAASANGYVAVDRGFAVQAGGDQVLKETADALAAHVGSTFAEAEGEILGDARVVAGAILQVDEVPKQFAGKWQVTAARHVFDRRVSGYRTRITVSGRHNRSLLALTSGRTGRDAPRRVEGVVCGVVTDVKDPLNLGRVKVMLPGLSPEYETTWAPVSQLFAGSAGGALFLPEPKDQVLVAFEHGDPRRPYVLGSLVNNRTGAGFHLDGSSGSAKPGAAAIGSGTPAPVIRRGLVSPSGSRLVFHDEVPPSGGQPKVAQVIVATGEDKIAITFDQVNGTLTIQCKPGSPKGTVKIECDGNVEVAAEGNVAINAGSNGNLAVDGGTQLSLKAKNVQIEATATMAIKGKMIKLN